jgi:UDP-GlcNAc:undecaprenyl-phosphate GlcNAc-1-phosphate transferase
MYLILFLFFALGFIDDKYQISPNKKLLLMIILIALLIYFDETVLIKKINFSFVNYKLSFGIFSYPFTILCFLLFINAFNMIDGINGQSISYAVFIFFLFILNDILINFSILISISLLFYLILNFSNKTYLGDNGSLLIGFLIAYIFVKTNNILDGQKFFSDEIFLIMLIPGFEIVRVAFTRLIMKRHPFSADTLHLHHMLIKRINFVKSYFVMQTLFILPYILYFITKFFFTSFLISLVFYILLIFSLTKNISRIKKY